MICYCSWTVSRDSLNQPGKPCNPSAVSNLFSQLVQLMTVHVLYSSSVGWYLHGQLHFNHRNRLCKSRARARKVHNKIYISSATTLYDKSMQKIRTVEIDGKTIKLQIVSILYHKHSCSVCTWGVIPALICWNKVKIRVGRHLYPWKQHYSWLVGETRNQPYKIWFY